MLSRKIQFLFSSKEHLRLIYYFKPQIPFTIQEFQVLLYNSLYSKTENGKLLIYNREESLSNEYFNAIKSFQEILRWSDIKYDRDIGLIESDEKVIELKQKREKKCNNYIKTLLENHDAYYCFCSDDRLKGLEAYDQHCLKINPKQIEDNLKNNMPYQIRFNIPKGKLEHEDLILGKSEIDHKIHFKSDPILQDKNGNYLAELLNIVDYENLKITERLDQSQVLDSSYLEMILAKTIDINLVKYAHIPYLMNQMTKPLEVSKIKTFDYFVKNDYSAKSLINYSIYLGMNNQEQKYDPKLVAEQLESFSLSKLSVHSPIYLQKTLTKINSDLIKEEFEEFKKKKPDLEVVEHLRSKLIKYLPDCEEEIKNSPLIFISQLGKLLLQNMEDYSDLKKLGFCFKDQNITKEKIQQIFKDQEKIKKSVVFFLEMIKNSKGLHKDEVNKRCSYFLYKNKKELNNKDVFHGIKFGMTGCILEILSLGEVCEILGREKVIRRLENYLTLLEI